MKKIENIVFDFGGVLVDWNPRYFYRTYFSDENEMEYFLTHICSDQWNAEQDRGRPFSEGMQLLQAQYPEYHEAIRLYGERWEDMVKGKISENAQLLPELKAQELSLYGLTNWSAETIPYIYRKFDFFGLFDGIVVSGEEHMIKPDKRLYQVLLDRYKFDAQASVFIDDNPDNIKAAQELGFNVIHFDKSTSVREKLSELSVL